MQLTPVRDSAELQRILNLPKRAELSDESWEAFARAWSLHLLNDAGKRELAEIEALPDADERAARFLDHSRNNRPLLLNVVQAQCIAEAVQCGGLFTSATVGAGKTLVSWLLALVLNARRPVLFVPASMVEDTHDKFREISKFWSAPAVIPFVCSYEWVGNNPTALCGCVACTRAVLDSPDGLRPDLVICDECDLLRNKDSGRHKRIMRYGTNHLATCRFAFLTATPVRKSLRNFAPQLMLALRHGAPVPISYMALTEWCESLDAGSKNKPRRPVGALAQLTPNMSTDLDAVREGFRTRLISTPGVVVSTKQSCDQPLTVRFIAPDPEPALDAAFEVFRTTQATLDGWDIDDPLSAFRYGTELGCNFYSMWDPRPPEPWLQARKEASVFVREMIAKSARSGRPLDTIGEVYKAFPNEPRLVAWREMEPTFKPNVVAVPVGVSVLAKAVAWLREHSPALVWVQHVNVGNTLAQMAGIPYYGPKGYDAHGRYIMKHDPKKSAIVSVHANKRGRNLQAWSTNLVVGPRQDAPSWEQAVFGRTHRQGQDKPVLVDVILACAENVKAVGKAIEEATFCRSVDGSQQKLLIATYDWSMFPAELLNLPREHPARPRWTLPE